MDNYFFRRVLTRYFHFHIGYGCPHRVFYSQSDFAHFLGVRQATVSSWFNHDSDISFFTLFRICLAFAVEGKKIDYFTVSRKSLDREFEELLDCFFDELGFSRHDKS